MNINSGITYEAALSAAVINNAIKTRSLFSQTQNPLFDIASLADDAGSKVRQDHQVNTLYRAVKRVKTSHTSVQATSIPDNTANDPKSQPSSVTTSTALSIYQEPRASIDILPTPVIPAPVARPSTAIVPFDTAARSQALAAHFDTKAAPPKYHAPWKLLRVISGHIGWVRSVAVDPSNDWFCSGSADRTIKIWDLATGQLRLTLNGHISAVRSLVVSARHPYLFSASEDKTVKCWDLEQNAVVRSYHGHLSGVYKVALHPQLDLVMSGGRDGTCRVWDMRSKVAAHVLTGHSSTVASIITQSSEPQLVTGSHDCRIKLWDLAAGKCIQTLTHHKHSIRSMANHPREFTFASASSDHIKVWQFPEGRFTRNIDGHTSILNAVAVNREDVLVSGSDDGKLRFIDWGSGQCFQKLDTIPQPGSIEAERAIFDLTFDMTGSRLLTAECDKTIKVYKPTA